MGRKPTEKQRRVAEKLIENTQVDNPKTGGEIVEDSGYGPSMSKNCHVVLNSEGVQMALEEYGFSEDRAKMVVADVMNGEKSTEMGKLKAADMVFKTFGTYAPDKSVNLNVEQQMMSDDDIQRLAKEINNQQKNAIHTGASKPSNGSPADSLDKEVQDQE